MLRVFSFGGGVQSTAALVLAAQGDLDFQTFLFCNVGADSENPATLEYIKDYSAPFAAQHGITLLEIQRVKRDGSKPTLLTHILTSARSVPIPVYMTNGAPGNRSCTYDYKIAVIDRWLREHGGKTNGATVGLGITMDEYQRMSSRTSQPWKTNIYPLIDLRLTRGHCFNIIQRAGLPQPPRSACWFCPFTDQAGWRAMRRHQPAQFQQAVDLETAIGAKRAALGRDPAYLSYKAIPLEQAVQTPDQGEMAFCTTNHCHT